MFLAGGAAVCGGARRLERSQDGPIRAAARVRVAQLGQGCRLAREPFPSLPAGGAHEIGLMQLQEPPHRNGLTQNIAKASSTNTASIPATNTLAGTW